MVVAKSGPSDNDDYSALNVTTIFDDDGKALKKLPNIGLGKENQVILSIQVDSASPVSFLKKKSLHEMKLRDPYFKIYPVDKATKDFYCGFTDNAINISGKVILPIFSNEWSHDNCHCFWQKDMRGIFSEMTTCPKWGYKYHISTFHISRQTRRVSP